MTERAVQAIEAIATHAQDNAMKMLDPTCNVYEYNGEHQVHICRYTQAIHVQFNNLWAYYAPGRKVSYQEGDEELLVEIARALDNGTFFAL